VSSIGEPPRDVAPLLYIWPPQLIYPCGKFPLKPTSKPLSEIFVKYCALDVCTHSIAERINFFRRRRPTERASAGNPKALEIR
jgi:hypothetical protein